MPRQDEAEDEMDSRTFQVKFNVDTENVRPGKAQTLQGNVRGVVHAHQVVISRPRRECSIIAMLHSTIVELSRGHIPTQRMGGRK